MNRVSIGSDTGLSPILRQAIILTKAGLLSTGPLGRNFSEISIKIQKLFIHKNTSENKVYEIAAILPWGSWINF